MERDGRLALVVGSFALLALGALAAAILSLTAERGIFIVHYRLESRFENVQGLLPGAPVWLAGKEVGRVEDIRFEPVGSDHPVLVLMGIDVDVQDRIRADSVASIGTIGVLGDSYVEVRVGTAGARMLADGEELPSQSPVNLNAAMAKGSRALDNVATLAENLNLVIEGFKDRDGSERFAEALESATDVMVRIQEGPGLLHSLVYDQYEGHGVASIERSLSVVEKILMEIHDGDGILHAMIFERPTDSDVVVKTMEAGARLNSILSKVDRGEGTLGLLVNDPTVYEDLQVLLGGAKRSVVLRSAVRMATESGQGEDK
jgi:phospholipid/cholesterol/gamma-HCH transport system substrate-binding protein